MKTLNAILVSAACLGVSACSISVTDDGIYDDYSDHHRDRLTVTLPNGDRDGFSCPRGTSSFVINRTDEGLGMVYGCRTDGAPMPTLEPAEGE